MQKAKVRGNLVQIQFAEMIRPINYLRLNLLKLWLAEMMLFQMIQFHVKKVYLHLI